MKPRDREGDPVDELMLRCLERPSEERAQAVREMCSTHPEYAEALRARFASLRGMGLDVMMPAADTAFPERLGDFRLIERLGGGGMGVVYLAEQTSLGREVALKLIRPEHLYFPRSRERFRREVEAVARLQHPGIVPVYTVGEEEGVPFFAMELVQGATLAEVLDALQGRAPESLRGADMARVVAERAGVEPLPLEGSPFDGTWVEAALRIARQVAEALEHAHGRGILHRDVKPSNVVVTPDGRAMLLDFGLTSSADSDRATRTGSQIGTLFYMSPEQMEGGRDADERTDVYSLGVTLYELLALQVPYRGDSRLQVQSQIADGRPDSIRARNRRVSAEAEIVCLKAMERDAGRRYDGAEAFARDLANVLELRPIEARPPGPLLRARRWAQRHPARTTALVAGVLLVVGTPSALLLQERVHAGELQDSLDKETAARAEAEEQALRYEQIHDFLIEIFQVADPELAQGETITARAVLESGTRRIRSELADQPRTRATLLGVMGRVYDQLGLYREAVPLSAEAVAILRDSPDADPAELDDALLQLATTLHRLGDYPAAEELIREVLERRRAAHGGDDWRVAACLRDLGIVYEAEQRFDEARDLVLQAANLMRADPDAPPLQLAATLGDQGSFLVDAAQHAPPREAGTAYEEAEELLREAIAIYEAEDAEDDLEFPALLNGLGLALKRQGRLDEAEDSYRAALERFRVLLGDENTQVATLLVNLAQMTPGSDDALASLREAAATFAELLPPEHPARVQTLGSLANMLTNLGEYEEAATIYRELIPAQIALYDEGHVYVAFARGQLGRCLLESGEHAEAEELLARSLEDLEAFYGPSFPDLAIRIEELGRLHLETDRPVEARELLDRARRVVEPVRDQARYVELARRIDAELAAADRLLADGEGTEDP